MATYYIFRHGETSASKGDGWYGLQVFSASILPEGYPAIRGIGEYLKTKPLDFCVSSPIRRCRQTTGIVEAIFSNASQPVDMGNKTLKQAVTGITEKEFVTDWRLSEYLAEPFWFFSNRIESIIRTIEQRGFERVAICTHGAVIGVMSALLTLGKATRKDVHEYPRPGVLLVIKNGKIVEQDFNLS